MRASVKRQIRADASPECRRKHAMHVLCERIRTGAMKINAALESAKTFASVRRLAAIKRVVDANADKKMALIRFTLELPIDDLEDFLELASLHKLTRLYRRDFVEESRAEFSRFALPKSAREIGFEVQKERELAVLKLRANPPKIRRIKTIDQSRKSALSK